MLSSRLRTPLIYAAIYVLVSQLLPQIFGLFIPKSTTGFWNSLNVGGYFFLAILAVVMFREVFREALVEIKNHPFKVLGQTAIAFVAIFAISALFLLLKGTEGAPTANQEAVNQFLTTSAFAVIIAVILGPVVEEIVFREILIGRLSIRFPVWLLSVASVVLFSLIHLRSFTPAGLMEAGQYIAIGVVMTALYLFNGRKLAYPLVGHAVNNLVATGLSFAAIAAQSAAV